VVAILVFFVAHWLLSVFCQTFFLHRYGAHAMFTMSKGWERFFHLLTFVAQGSSYLNPRAYAILHREHHAFSDTERDPHSPHTYPNLIKMMLVTKARYQGIQLRTITPEARFEGNTPEWPLLDKFGRTWASHILFMALYTAFYVKFVPVGHEYLYGLLPAHFMMGPIHGAIVNWCGHKYGYRNFALADHSRNSFNIDLLLMGELFQNNHHRFPNRPNFAVRWFEFDPTYPLLRLLQFIGVIRLKGKQ
jgi:stearoyl-CoA desaturase (Delta-9 desaturase)